MTFAEFLAVAPGYIEIALQVVGAAAVLAAAIPGSKDDVAVSLGKKVLLTLKSILNIVGANFAHAKNAEDVVKAPAAKLEIKD